MAKVNLIDAVNGLRKKVQEWCINNFVTKSQLVVEQSGAVNFMNFCEMSPQNYGTSSAPDLLIVFDNVNNDKKNDITSIKVHSSVDVIGANVCADMKSLTAIDVGKNTRSIESEAFKDDTALTTVMWPEQSFSIGNNAFEGCTALTSPLPTTTTYSIGDKSFAGCASLPSELDLSRATSLGNYAFKGSSIKDVTINDLTSCGTAPFAYCNLDTLEGTGASFSCIDNCLISNFSRKMYQGSNNSIVPNDVTEIVDNCFAGLTEIERITIPATVTTMGANVFNDCSNLTELNILSSTNNTTYNIDGYSRSWMLRAAKGCDKLEHLTLPWIPKVDSLYTQENGKQRLGAFFYHETNHSVPNSNSGVPDTLSTVEITNQINIDEQALYGIDSLTSVIFHNAKTLGYGATASCPNLEKIVVGSPDKKLTGTVTAPISMIRSCSNIKEVYIYAEDATRGTENYGPETSGTTSLEHAIIPGEWLHKTSYFSNLKTVECMRQASTDEGGFENLETATILNYYSQEQADSYHSATSSTRRTLQSMFCNSGKLKSVSLPSMHTGNSMITTIIPSGYLTGCPNLASITYDDTVRRWNASDIEKTKGWIDHDCIIVCTDGLVSAEDGIFNPNKHTAAIDQWKAGDLGILTDTTTDLVLPSFLIEDKDGKVVTIVTTFDRIETLKTVTLPEYSDSLQLAAFAHCSNLESVVMPNTLTYIGDQAFHNCKKLTSIEIPENVDYIGRSAFSNCESLTDITIPSSATILLGYTFSGCEQLQNVNLPSTLKSIGENEFEECSALTTVTFYGTKDQWKEQVTKGTNWDANSSEFTVVCYDGQILPIDSGASAGLTYTYRSSSAEVTGIGTCEDAQLVITTQRRGSPVTSIASNAFSSNAFIQSVSMPSIESIGQHAFSGCASLTEITLSKTLQSLGEECFLNCSKLATINFVDGTLAEWSDISKASNWDAGTDEYVLKCTDGHFGVEPFSVTADNLSLIGFTGAEDEELIIPASFVNDGHRYKVTAIEGSAFSDCSELVSITIPRTVETINNTAFIDAPKLAAINIDDRNETFKSKNGVVYSKDETKLCFYPCGKADESLVLEEGLQSIDNLAFQGNDLLVSIVLPQTLTTIANEAFRGCTGLRSINVPDSVTSIGSFAFYGCNITTATMPTTAISAIPKTNLTTVVLTSGTSIGNAAFSNCDALTSITIPDSVTSIGNGAFIGCSGLTSITIPDSVTSIGTFAFQSCSSLTSLTIGESVTSIGVSAFNGCSSLTSVTIPDSVTTISDSAFNDCSALSSVTIGDSVTNIGGSAFRDCSNLTSVTIPDSVTNIGLYAFCDCKNLQHVNLPNSLENIDEHMFENCYRLEKIVLPSTLTNIKRSAFVNCYALKQIHLPETMQGIAQYAFANCYMLQEIDFPEGMSTTGSDAFVNCCSLTNITIPASLQGINSNVFKGCSALETIKFNGSRSAWDSMSKGTDWDANTRPYSVICSDNDNIEINVNTPTIYVEEV